MAGRQQGRSVLLPARHIFAAACSRVVVVSITLLSSLVRESSNPIGKFGLVARARWSWASYPGLVLSAIRAAATREGLYALDLVADLLVKDGVGQED